MLSRPLRHYAEGSFPWISDNLNKGSGKQASEVFRICGVTSFHPDPRGCSQGTPPRLPILRISCQNSPMRNLTITICLNLALDCNTNVIWEISDRKMNRAEKRRQQKGTRKRPRI